MADIRRYTLIALVTALLAAPAAWGQPSSSAPSTYPIAPPPPVVSLPQPQTHCDAGVCLPPSVTAMPQPSAYPPSVYNPYGYPGYQGRVGGALSGYADVINSSAQANVTNQQARVMQTQADMSRLDYRNALLQQERYEKSLLPTTTEMRQQDQWRQLESARNNPPNPEIWSGEALNALLRTLQTAETSGLHADAVFLDPAVLKHINLTTGQMTSGNGAGMLKSITNLDWPFAMQDAPYVSTAADVNALGQKAVQEIRTNGRVTAATFKALDGDVAAMTDAVRHDGNLSPTDWILCKSFMDDLRSSIQILRDPNVAQYLGGGAYMAKGPTVYDLVKQMTTDGLHFAPAAEGDQPSYSNLYQALRTYDYRLAQLASR